MIYRSLLLAVALVLQATATPMNAVRAPGRDCGTWTMYCGGVPSSDGKSRGQSAEGACNNACYYINFQQNGDYTATYDSTQDNTKSREQSGCQTTAGSASGSVCNAMPFSQKFHDVFEQESDPTKQAYNCDEFPMAEMKQNDFSSGTIRNTLRCIPAKENSSGGQQLSAFISDQGNGLAGRDPKCSGKLQDGDTFKVAFNYDGADTTKLPYCKYPNNGSPNRFADPYQFYMTQIQGMHGTIDMPYNSARDNHYAIANSGKDVLQCRVDVTRTSGDNYEATVYDVDGTKQGEAAQQLPQDEDKLVVPGKGGLQDLAIFRTAEMGKAGTKGSKVDFNYGDHDFAHYDTVNDFNWSSDSSGTANQYAKQDPDVTQPAGYCKVPNIDENEDGDSQTITCYFPCNAS